MLNPPSAHSAMTWRERSSAWMPLAWPSAVPTAALLKEPMIRCDPLWRIQLADHSVVAVARFALARDARRVGDNLFIRTAFHRRRGELCGVALASGIGCTNG